MRFDFQVLKNLKDDESKFTALQKTTFLAEHVTYDLPGLLSNYFDGVKE